MTRSPASRVGGVGFRRRLEDAPIRRRSMTNGARARHGEAAMKSSSSNGRTGPWKEAFPFGQRPRRRSSWWWFRSRRGNQPMRLKPHLRLANADPFLARLFDIRPRARWLAEFFLKRYRKPARQRSGISLLAVAQQVGRQFRHGDIGFLDTCAKRNDRCGSSSRGVGRRSAWYEAPRMRNFKVTRAAALKWPRRRDANGRPRQSRQRVHADQANRASASQSPPAGSESRPRHTAPINGESYRDACDLEGRACCAP